MRGNREAAGCEPMSVNLFLLTTAGQDCAQEERLQLQEHAQQARNWAIEAGTALRDQDLL